MRKRSAFKKKRDTSLSLVQSLGLVVGGVLFSVPFLVEIPGLSPVGCRMFSIFLLAVVFWITESIPLYATATLIIFLEVLLVSDRAVLSLPEGYEASPYSAFFQTLADPILMLFLGGFFLAEGASMFRLDTNLARVLLKPFGTSPRKIVLGVMAITALFSMFMSNTATTATLMAVVLPVIAQLSKGDRTRTALALSIPVAANIGGMGTPIGTPPNAIALGALQKAGFNIGFLEWMAMMVPFMLVVLVFAWFVIVRLFPPLTREVHIRMEGEFDTAPGAVLFYATFALTLVLWLTEQFHGMTSSTVGFFPVVVLLSTRVFGKEELQKMPWHVLWLVGGGIALGKGVGSTGLDLWLIGLVGWESFRPDLLLGIFALVALLISTFISNSATANLIVPIGVGLATSGTLDIGPVGTAVAIAVGCSLAMALPVTTPPNAIAFSSGAVRTKDLAICGTLIGLWGWLVYLFCFSKLWDHSGLLTG